MSVNVRPGPKKRSTRGQLRFGFRRGIFDVCYLPSGQPPARPILPMRVFRLLLITLCCGVTAAAKGAGAEESSAPAAGASPPIPPDLTVAADGTGNFKTVQDALNAIARGNRERLIVFIKDGLYHEKIRIDPACITLLGQSR